VSLTSALFCNFFFFSSRRRHTRSKRDWSSDVCSSDLHALTLMHYKITNNQYIHCYRHQSNKPPYRISRSEERRVGKECGSGSQEEQYRTIEERTIVKKC